MSSIFAHAPYSITVESQVHYDIDNQSSSYIHDPYSFAGFITLKDEPQYCYCRRLSLVGSDCGEPLTSDCSISSTSPSTPPSDHNETSSEDGNAIAPAEGSRRRRVRYVRGPCGHKNSKRLRFKNGQGQYICLECNLKWRSAFDEQL